MFPQQGKDDTGLGSRAGYGRIPEGFRNYGELCHIPYFAGRMVAFWFGRLKEMADTVSNGYGFILIVTAFASAARGLRKIPGNGRFFAKYQHNSHLLYFASLY
jgi:hypothetical protein